MTNAQNNGNEKVELVEVTHDRLAEVTGGMYDAFRTSSVNGYVTGGAGAIGGVGGFAPLENFRKAGGESVA
jgi:hypothetical protein